MENSRDLYCCGASTDRWSRSLARWIVAFGSGIKLVDKVGFGKTHEAECKALIAALDVVMKAPLPEHVTIHIHSRTIYMLVMKRSTTDDPRLVQLMDIVRRLIDTTTARTLSLSFRYAPDNNPAHVEVDDTFEPDVFDGVRDVIKVLPGYEGMLASYNKAVDDMVYVEGERNVERRHT